MSLILVPAIGAVLVMLVSKRRPISRSSSLSSVATAGLAIWLLWAFEADAEGFTSCRSTRGSRRGGSRGTSASTGSRRFSSCSRRCRSALDGDDPHHDDKPYLAWMLLSRPAVMNRQLHQPRPVRVLHLLRDRARADASHRRLGVRAARLRGAPKSSSCSRCVHVRRHHRHRLHRRRSRPDHVRPRRASPRAPTSRRRRLVVLRVRGRVRGQAPQPRSTGCPDAHTTGADRRLGRARRRVAELGTYASGCTCSPRWPAVLTLGVIGITYGAIVAAMENDLKRLVAYSSITSASSCSVRSCSCCRRSAVR